MQMSRIKVGDTVAFRHTVASRCGDPQSVAAIRGVVTQVCGSWLFLHEADGTPKVMPLASMCKVARNGLVLELV
jgi:hypothetical protein